MRSAAPVHQTDRITSLDTIRGFAVLGILTMNVVSFGFDDSAPYFNIDATSPQGALDWVIGSIGEVFFDQKFMGLFSMLFGAGIVLFADRAAAKGARPIALSLWRNGLLLLIGIAHTLVWDGDILTVYAICAPLILALRRLSTRVLAIAGTACVLTSAVWAAFVQATVGPSGVDVGDYWVIGGDVSDAVGLWLIGDFFLRALGMMLIGVAAYRDGFLAGARSDDDYRRAARWGLGIGLPLAASGYALVVLNDFGFDVALIGAAPNTVATIPIVIGYIAVATLWHRRTSDSAFNARIRATGRMALTNYLTQTVLGVFLLGALLEGSTTTTRTGLAAFTIGVWALQLWWSPLWLRRHRYGPAEWAWRVATYRRLPGR